MTSRFSRSKSSVAIDEGVEESLRFDEALILGPPRMQPGFGGSRA